MQGVQEGLKKVMQNAGIGRIRKIGERECEECGSTVPIMERSDREGNVFEESLCLSCETNKTRSRFPDKGELLRAKAQGFSIKYEVVPKKLLGKTVSEYQTETDSEKLMKNTIADYIMNFGKTKHNSLILAGQMGVGKSHLAYATAAELRKQGYSTMFIAADDFLKLIKSTYEKETDLSEKTIFEMIQEIDLLVFDEIGAEYNNQKGEYESWASEKILKVTDLREDLPTIYTTNYSPADFEGKYGAIQGGRIVSRMQAGAKRIVVEGRDRR
ncbi:ATP-binding protein [Virgibacillus halodenitrificans]|uniref:ATP-binding protein n=1 Tax=Virgibacillus halodenitrificans TaxID=1482 RepID=A0ABR7VS48_VIRHA|nr:ATP-binding protein [Virgibacillus halodenitrificans]MBD1223264.1 ATP-binding protein [Virgibacillus halodenitrificans]